MSGGKVGMLRKCGVVFEKPISEWFDPDDVNHLRALACRRKTGAWPPRFRPDGVWEDPGWEKAVAAKTEGRLPDEVVAWADEYDRLVNVVMQVRFPGYSVVVNPLGDDFYVRVSYVEPDVMTGVPETQEGRRWLFPRGQTAGQVVQTVFKAILTSLEHRAREHFTYRGRAVLQPHIDVDALWAASPEGSRHPQEVFARVA